MSRCCKEIAMRTCRLLALVAVLVLASPGSVWAFKFCTRVTPLREESANAKLVLYGHLEDAQQTTDGEGTTKFVICTILKNDPILGNQRVITLSRYIPIDDPKNPPHYLIFVDVWRGKFDVYRGVRATLATVNYLKGSMRLSDKDRPKVLRYCADYLEHKDREIAADAFGEFSESSEKDIVEAGKQLSAQMLRRWLLDKNTAPFRLSLYGLLLGNCGSEADARTLRGLLEHFTKEESPLKIDGLLTGYVLLKPKEGWAYLRSLLQNRDLPFAARYSCLRTARFFHDTRPGVIQEKDILAVMGLALVQSDMADLPIEDLRKWRCWTMTKGILALSGQKEYDIPIIRRSIVRYALHCPDPEAAEFVAAQRKVNPELVKDQQELLQLEKSDDPKK
jgi:hypothetical protein